MIVSTNQEVSCRNLVGLKDNNSTLFTDNRLMLIRTIEIKVHDYIVY